MPDEISKFIWAAFSAKVLTWAALMTVALILVLLQRPEHRSFAWWVRPAPVNKSASQIHGVLLSLALVAVAWWVQAGEYTTLECEAGKLRGWRKQQTDGTAVALCQEFQPNPNSILDNQVSACGRTALRHVDNGERRTERIACLNGLAKERANFTVLGFSVDLAAARHLLASLYAVMLTVAGAVMQPGAPVDGVLGTLLARRVLRMGYLIATGWVVAYLVGYTFLGVASGISGAAAFVGAATLAILAIVVAVRTRHKVAIAWAVGCLVFVGVALRYLPALVVPASVAACTASLVLLELLGISPPRVAINARQDGQP